jgi:hypothetical protein
MLRCKYFRKATKELSIAACWQFPERIFAFFLCRKNLLYRENHQKTFWKIRNAKLFAKVATKTYITFLQHFL